MELEVMLNHIRSLRDILGNHSSALSQLDALEKGVVELHSRPQDRRQEERDAAEHEQHLAEEWGLTETDIKTQKVVTRKKGKS